MEQHQLCLARIACPQNGHHFALAATRHLLGKGKPSGLPVVAAGLLARRDGLHQACTGSWTRADGTPVDGAEQGSGSGTGRNCALGCTCRVIDGKGDA
jgi:hypothetical protein